MSQLLWTQKQDIGPAARSSVAMAFDSGRGRVVLFGGLAANSPLNDTWEWDGESRASAASAYDTTRQRMVLFGGAGTSVPSFGDTWELAERA